MVRAIDRTTRLFVASLKVAAPELLVSVDRSRNTYGRSNYVHIRDADRRRYWKVRISDHSVGMRRALSGREDCYIAAGAGPSTWAVWLGDLMREVRAAKAGA